MKQSFLLLSTLMAALIMQGQPCLPTVSYPITWEIEDNSGNNFDPELMGGASITGEYLNIGYNNVDYLNIPPEVLDGIGDFTIQFDFRLTAFNLSGAAPTNSLIAGSSASDESEFAISYEKSINAIVIALKGTGKIFNITLNTGTWYCLQLIRNGVNVTLYMDGVAMDSEVMSNLPLDISFLQIGQELDCPGGCFVTNQCLNGNIDNFSIYPCAFQEANCQPYFAPCDTMLLYPFDANVIDFSGNENNGIINGDANTAAGYLEIGYNDDDYIDIPVTAINGLQEFTISFNFKLNAFNTAGTSPTNTFIAGTDVGVEHEFALSYEKSSEAFEVAIHNIGGSIPAIINENEWYCISYIWNNDTLNISLNGVVLPGYLVFPDDPISVSLLEIGQELDCVAGCFAENQCLNGSMDNLIIRDCIESIQCAQFPDGIFDVSNANDLKLYPNPADTWVTIVNMPENIKTLQVYNINGIEQNIIFNKYSNQIDISTLVPGLYILPIQGTQGLQFIKFVKG